MTGGARGKGRTYEELDVRETPLGTLILRRRRLPGPRGPQVTEVTLDGAFLMSSFVHASETALAMEALARCPGGDLNVLVGGLGLGYTAEAARTHPGVRSLRVIELLPAVIDWHRRGLVPLGDVLASDPRCVLEQGDFFALMRSPPATEDATWHAILVDIDHSPRAALHAEHAGFYEVARLREVLPHLAEGGVFSLWSADAPDPAFLAKWEEVFAAVEVRTVEFYNPSIDGEEVNSIYLGRRP
ncbi:MAG: spermidine synthase family protein [Planctomycetota bacterium]